MDDTNFQTNARSVAPKLSASVNPVHLPAQANEWKLYRERFIEAAHEKLKTFGLTAIPPILLLQHSYEFGTFLNFAKDAVQEGFIVEIGGYLGGTHYLFRQITPRVVSFENNFLHTTVAHLLLNNLDITPLWIDESSDSPNARKRLLNLLHNKSIDVLFIDGNHDETAILHDFYCFYPLVRPGGLVGLHDWMCKVTGVGAGVRRATTWLEQHGIALQYLYAGDGIAYHYKPQE